MTSLIGKKDTKMSKNTPSIQFCTFIDHVKIRQKNKRWVVRFRNRLKITSHY